MKLSEFKEKIILRLRLLRACTYFSFKEATAYAGNNYGNMLSTFLYMATYLIFIGALFNKVTIVAGYSYGEILLLTLIHQINFYLISSVSLSNTDLLAKNVKSGDLDLWISRPVPLLWFVTFQKININGLVMDAIPATIPLIYLVIKNFNSVVLPINLLSGLAIIIMGAVIAHCFQFILNLSCFWTGENQNMRILAFELGFFGDSIPFEGYSTNFRRIGIFFIPSIISSALATSVMLGKNTNPFVLPVVFGIMLLFLWLNIKIWRLALRHYSSASS
jgi:ABC-2 type transport system permease protein